MSSWLEDWLGPDDGKDRDYNPWMYVVFFIAALVVVLWLTDVTGGNESRPNIEPDTGMCLEATPQGGC